MLYKRPLRNIALTTLIIAIFTALACITPLIGVAAPLAQNANFTVDSAQKIALPNTATVYTFTLANTGASQGSYAIRVTRSCAGELAGCTESLSDSTLTIPASGVDTFTLTVNVPATTSDNNVFSGVTVNESNGAGTVAPSTITVLTQVRLVTPTPVRSGVQLTVTTAAKNVLPGGSVTFDFTLRNPGGATGSYILSFTQLCSADQPNCSENFNVATTQSINAATQISFQVTVSMPNDAVIGVNARTRVQAVEQYSGGISEVVITSLIVSSLTPSPSPTSTTIPPTGTPLPVCIDGFEFDDNPASARPIDVNTAQRHVICPVNDEDWLFFGGVAGKNYTIDVPEMAPGIDLSLELFDKNMRSIAFNDDFFDRNPLNPGDTRPRIQSFTIPADGIYYIRVRDNAARGGFNYTYTVSLSSDSYGPTPITISELCYDKFEPDGLPEQAPLITSNELQEDRRLCPTGDADWVRFFGKAGKRYVMFTDTRRYRGVNQVNRDTLAGADTVMVLADRDGVSILDANDDIPGGETFDSQIEFVPSVDGFYYLQIKNVGDVGNQFIRYDVTLLLCLPGQTDCGRVSGSTSRSTPVFPGTPPVTGTPYMPPTPRPTNTPTNTATTRVP